MTRADWTHEDSPSGVEFSHAVQGGHALAAWRGENGTHTAEIIAPNGVSSYRMIGYQTHEHAQRAAEHAVWKASLSGATAH